jgi:glycosyltransferase involved in cell wall biosynthesis
VAEALAGPEAATLDLTVVVPYYNPGSLLRRHLVELDRVLTEAGLDYELVAVSDGSTDGSPASLDGVAPDRLRRLELAKNRGKGEALRTGLAVGRGRYLGFIDADGDIPAQQLRSFVSLLDSQAPDIVAGSKRHPASVVAYPPARRLYSWGYQQLCRVLFDLDLRDTQTGIKLIRREVLAAALPRTVEERFAFDLELLVVAAHLGYRDIVELPVTIRERFTTTVSLRTVGEILTDTLRVWWRLRIRHAYDAEPGAGSTS